MSQVFLSDDPSPGPRLHAFVVGVADYPHLVDGGGEMHETPIMLGQVTTPHFTALRILQWLQGEYHNPLVPLGSIEMLLSSTVELPVPVQRATMAAFEESYDRWLVLANSHRENILFFYFCGHGVNNTEQFLLMEDFAKPRKGLWRNALNFSKTALGLRSCKADTQILVVDACSERERTLSSTIAPDAPHLGSATFSDSVTSQNHYFAAAEGAKAYGPPDKETYFCQAFLASLNGAGARNREGPWLVYTDTLGLSLQDILQRIATKARLDGLSIPPLTCRIVPGSSYACFHHPKSPNVLVTLECSTEEGNLGSEFCLEAPGKRFVSPHGEPRPWLTEAPPGMWNLTVNFANSPPVVEEGQVLTPPIFRRKVVRQS